MNLGIVGWRGMVGSVLINRMDQYNDFGFFNTTFLSSSNFKSKLSTKYPDLKYEKSDNLDCLLSQDIIISCQGSEYTKKTYPILRKKGWSGYWVDAASSLRMNEDSIIVLDPLNKKNIIDYINNNGKTFCGGNCTVSLLLLAIQGLIDSNLLSWVSSMTYQSVSGAGASCVKELLMQMRDLSNDASINVDEDTNDLLDKIDYLFANNNLSTKYTQIPLIGNLIPWIDSDLNNGQSREEWKGGAEANKILNNKNINLISVHYRGHEFLIHHHKVNNIFKKNAIDFILKNVINPYFLIFTDDIDCIDFKLFENINFQIIKDNEDYIDLWLMSLCKHNILSNSTFSWWGAFLNKNPSKYALYDKNITYSYYEEFKGL